MFTAGNGVRLTLVTSICPGNPAPQQRAIASWLAVPQIDVVSVNAAIELPAIRAEGYDPRVRFVEASRDGRDLVGKPLIRIYDAVRNGLASDAAIIGIVNSDVMLRLPTDFVRAVWPHVQGGLLFGSRTDIPNADADAGQVYFWGFDYFFMDRTALDCVEDDPFFFGVPWWDYWLPMAFIIADRQTRRIATPIGFHVSHPVRWDPTLYDKVGNLYGDFIRRNFQKRGWAAIAGPHPEDPYWGVGTLRRLGQCDVVHL